MLALVLFAGFLAGTATALVLVLRGLRKALSSARREPGQALRAAAFVLGGAAVGVYAWGMAHAGLAVLDAEDGGTGSSPIRPCREADPDRAVHVVDYHVGFVPLDFECRLSGGGSYTTSTVPGYVNPATAVLGLAGVVCGIFSAADAERRTRTSPTPPSSKGDS
ncbi:hypothetical protein ACIRPX_27075 [Streptomyces sp. NPDC101225]|uniref:hypothetical protein n=1 Tax=Streptomyces sp. NPDC101225 TaxID=3366135 RepID=UPI0038225ABD